MASIFNNQEGIAICGSHGKTSVSAMLAFVLEKLNFSPQALVGAYVPQLKGAALAGKSKYLLAELDEYQNKLQYFKPKAIVLNSIDYDHPDFFKTKSSYLQAFAEFVKKLKQSSFLVLNLANKESRDLLKYTKAKIYGYALASKLSKEHKHLKLLAHSLRQDEKYQYFKLNDFGEFKIQLFGEYNVENALAVLSTGLALGISPVEQRPALANFKGLSRRAELRGEYRGVKIYDDYGHHPNEIKVVLQSFKERFTKNKLIVVFQPHTFTRTKKFFSEFVDSLSLADELYILEIYSSAREQKINLSSKDLLKAYKKRYSRKEAKYFAKLNQAEQFLRTKLKKGDLVLLLGAGDTFRLADRLLA